MAERLDEQVATLPAVPAGLRKFAIAERALGVRDNFPDFLRPAGGLLGPKSRRDWGSTARPAHQQGSPISNPWSLDLHRGGISPVENSRGRHVLKQSDAPAFLVIGNGVGIAVGSTGNPACFTGTLGGSYFAVG